MRRLINSSLFHAQQKGFTLVEVLVALAIVSVTLAAFVRLSSQSIQSQQLLEQTQWAWLAADNSAAEIVLGSVPEAGVHQFACPQDRYEFICRVSVRDIGVGMVDVSVHVYADIGSDYRLASLSTQIVRSNLP